MSKIISDFVCTCILIFVLAYPLRSIWNNGVVKAISITQEINYIESMNLVGGMYVFAFITYVLFTWGKNE